MLLDEPAADELAADVEVVLLALAQPATIKATAAASETGRSAAKVGFLLNINRSPKRWL
jgi:hypothetical protein